MVGVQVAQRDGVDAERVGVVVQRPERAVADVEQDPPGAVLAVGLEEVAARRRVRAGVRAGAPDHREPHADPAGELAGGHHLRAQEPAADPLELVGRARGGEVVRRLAALPHQVGADEHLVDVLRALLGAADQRDVVAHHVGDDTGEQRVVRAAEDQRVDAGLGQRVEVLVRDRDQLVAAGDPGLDEVDEPRAGPGRQLDVRRRGERVLVGHRLGRGARADDADPAGAGGGDRPAGRGVDHLDDGDVVPLAGVAQHRRARGVAGDDQCLDPLGVQVVEALQGVLADLADRLRTVGLAGGVAEVAHRLVGQLVDHRPRHGEAAETGVEDPDGSVDGSNGRHDRQA